MSKIIECNVWCSESDEEARMGLPDGDCWMPISIDFDHVSAIKLAGPNDFIGDDKATIYLPTANVIVDLTYAEAIAIWKTNML
jgi:hypothetical protein